MTPCVFLHGFLGSPAEWDPVIGNLETDADAIVPQLPIAAEWSAGVDRLCALLPPRFVLIGYSLGARVALGITFAVPDRVRGLCLISGNPGLTDPEERSQRGKHDAALANRLEQVETQVFLQHWYQQSVFASVPPAIRAAWVQQRTELDRRYQADLLRCYSISNQPDYWARLSELSMSLEVIVGEMDDKYLAIAREMSLRYPPLQLHVVPSVGHAVHREDPGTVSQILHSFISEMAWEEEGDE